MAILRGEYRDGERIGEQEVAKLYGVSRGPVRDALRILQSRSIVTLEPRRGACAIGVSLDMVADLFNARAALLGMAARCFARLADAQPLAQFSERLAHLREMAPMAISDPIEFAQKVGRANRLIYDHCGNAILTRMLREQGATSLWGFIWREQPLDYFTPERRASCINDLTAIETAVYRKDEAEAEACQRKLLLDSRDTVLQTLAEMRGGKIDPTKMVR